MKTNIEILENLSINHKKLKEDKPYLLFKILKAMDIARTEQLTLTDVMRSDCDLEKLVNENREYILGFYTGDELKKYLSNNYA